MKKFQEYSRLIVAFVFCVAVIAVYKTFDSLGNIWQVLQAVFKALRPFGVGFIIAYMLNLPSKKLTAALSRSKYKFAREKSYGLGVLITYLIALIAVIATLWLLLPALSRNVLDLYNNFPSYVSSATDYLRKIDIVNKLRLLGDRNDRLYEMVSGIFSKFDVSELGKYAQGVFTFTSGLLEVFIAIISSIYMLLDKNQIIKAINKFLRIILKDTTAQWLNRHFKRINEIFTNYIYSRLTCSVIMAIVCSIALSLLRVKYAIILGIFIGAMDMIPYFGSIISCVFSCAVTLVTGGLWKMIWSGAVLLVLQQIDGNLLGPKIMGDSLEIRPLWIIFAVTVGGNLFGFMGMLLSVPVLAVIRAIIVDQMLELQDKKQSKAEAVAAAGESEQ